MSRIPQGRALLIQLASDIETRDPVTAQSIRRIVRNYLVRQSPLKRAPARHTINVKTPGFLDDVERYFILNPLASHQDCASVLGTNPGRVSEAYRVLYG